MSQLLFDYTKNKIIELIEKIDIGRFAQKHCILVGALNYWWGFFRGSKFGFSWGHS